MSFPEVLMEDDMFCEDCKKEFVAMLENRIVKILQITREESEGDQEIGQSHCFHLMELIRKIEGKNTCGVFD